jgi:hypothetical protein
MPQTFHTSLRLCFQSIPCGGLVAMASLQLVPAFMMWLYAGSSFQSSCFSEVEFAYPAHRPLFQFLVPNIIRSQAYQLF